MTTTGHTTPASHDKARDERAFRTAARHSTHVRLAKIGLPVLGLAGAAVFAGFTVFARPDLPNIAVDLTKTVISDGKVVMSNPRLSGFTSNDKPYEMEAERAIQDVGNTAEILLENIQASVPFRGEAAARILAPTALFNNDARTLDIDQPFTVVSSDGLSASLKSAFVDIAKGNMETDEGVDITVEGTRITAQSMRISDNGKRMVFENNVRLNIAPASAKSMTAAQGAPQNGDN